MQKALSQSTPGHVPPVCFSFGWVAYSFTALVSVIGDGRLLPPPDFPVKVFNLKTGYVRENKSWIIGRILRDNELFMNQYKELKGAGIRISVYTAEAPEQPKPLTHWSERIWFCITTIQIAIAIIPIVLDREWGVFFVTFCGILAAIATSQLPQWNVEKMSCKKKEKNYIALTSGNGSRDIMIIYSAGMALDLEELAASESPRSDRVWAASKLFSYVDKGRVETTQPEKEEDNISSESNIRSAYMYKGLPLGLWFTRIACFLQAFFWILLLITVAGLRSHTWFLVCVGGLGMLQNAIVASVARSPTRRGLPLTLVDTIVEDKVMDGLMDLERTINGAGQALLDEFFPGSLRKAEYTWWSGNEEPYDKVRLKDKKRGRPRSQLIKKNTNIPDISFGDKVRLDRRVSSWDTSVSNEEFRSATRNTRDLAHLGMHDQRYTPTKSEYTIAPRTLSYEEDTVNSVRSPDWA